jgi:hypothetical protein
VGNCICEKIRTGTHASGVPWQDQSVGQKSTPEARLPIGERSPYGPGLGYIVSSRQASVPSRSRTEITINCDFIEIACRYQSC